MPLRFPDATAETRRQREEADCCAEAHCKLLQMTTVGMVRQLDVPKGEWIIQTAAGSSLGRMVISVAKQKGVSFKRRISKTGHMMPVVL